MKIAAACSAKRCWYSEGRCDVRSYQFHKRSLTLDLALVVQPMYIGHVPCQESFPMSQPEQIDFERPGQDPDEHYDCM